METDTFHIVNKKWSPKWKEMEEKYKKTQSFFSNKVDKAFKIWKSKGIEWYHQMYNETGLESFENMGGRYLPRSHFYR